MFSTIVVGVDGRQGGRDALHLAHTLSRVGSGRIVALRVFPFAYPLRGAPPMPDEPMREETLAALDRDVDTEGVAAATVVLGDMSPARGLHRLAEHEGADVIVVGSTHHGRLGRVFAGDDAVATLHGSHCPVAVAPRGYDAPTDGPLRRIGVGYDGGPESGHALLLADMLARRTGAHLHLLSVISTPIDYTTIGAFDSEWVEQQRAEAETVLGEALGGLDVEASGETVLGFASDELTELSHRVDLLVVGSRAWGPARRILLGSTAATLIRGAGCPVLVVPRGAPTGQPGEREPAGTESASPAGS